MTDIKANMLSEEEFRHAGVKGMKWGRRKAEPTKSAHVSADAARVKKIEQRLKKHGPTNLSNDDIAKLNKRSQLMSEYKKNNPSKLKKGQTATKEALSSFKMGKEAIGAGITIAALASNPNVRSAAKTVIDIVRNMK